MNKTLESLLLLNRFYDSFQKKKKLCESVQKKEFNLQEEENRSADQFNKGLILPDISLYFDDSFGLEDRCRIKEEFMRSFDRFEKKYADAKKAFNDECAKRKESVEEEFLKGREEYSKQISEIDAFLGSSPVAAEYFEDIPQLSKLINEGSADSIEKAVCILSNRKRHSIN